MAVNPLSVPCPKCLAEQGAVCVRVTGPYGIGQPLRRMHTDRFKLAAQPAAERRRSHHQRRVAARRAQGG